MMIYFIGIDPGKNGAIYESICSNPGELQVSSQVAHKMPVLAGKGRKQYDLREISKLVDQIKRWEGFVTIERTQPLPPMIKGKPMGSIANFERGQSMGWLWLFEAFGIRYEAVSAQRWQKEMLADIPGTDTKQRALVAARRLWPNADWMIPKGCRKPHDGIIDAALICEYGRRRHGASI
jgi:hypothetical protein